MKKSVVLLASVLALSACQAPQQKVVNKEETKCDTLSVLNFSEYMKEDIYKRFEKDFNVKVVYEIAETNEAMDLKVTAGVTKYDVIMPSDYIAEKWIKEGLVQKLDKNLIPNAQGIYENLLNPEFDKGNEYSLPYFWGTVGIMYNSETVDIKDLEEQGWAIFKNPKYHGRTYLYDSERDGFMPALRNLGFSMNATKKEEIDAAVNWLNEVNKITEPVYVNDQVIDGMSSGEKDLAVVYSGDASLITKENPKMQYFMPKEGTNYWHDDMMIYKGSKCSTLANQFINYMLNDANMEENTIEIGYTPPKTAVFEKLASTEFDGISSFKPVVRPQDEVLKYNPENKKILSELWLKIKLK